MNRGGAFYAPVTIMSSTQALYMKDLSFSWNTKAPPILTIPSLTVAKGDSLFIQGPSGSGKSTLLNLISGVLAPQSGEIRLLEQAFSSLNQNKRDEFRASHIGYIFQQFNLLPYLTVIENVVLPVKLSAVRRKGKSRHSTELVEEAKHWLSQLQVPTSLFSEKVSRLSIGQQQRVAAARAMIGAPEIIIADEPTSALDQQNVDNFMSVLVEQCASIQSSLIFVSHDLNLSSYFEHQFSLAQFSTEETR